MNPMRALSILHGLAPLDDEGEAMLVLEWAEAHPEEINTGTLQQAVESVRWFVEGGAL